MAYAHAVIVDPRDRTRYELGDEVPVDLPGFDELLEAGSVADEPYDPESEPTQIPDYVEIEGVRYVKVNDGSETEDVQTR